MLMSKNTIYEKIGKRVKEAREISGMAQADLAEKVGVSVTYISSIERGVSFPRGEVLVEILNALNVSADFVFCDVVSGSLKQKSCLLYDMIQCLQSREQVKILEVVDLLIRQRGENYL
jgi:transcriptional regulator with XRE-family HTH domain